MISDQEFLEMIQGLYENTSKKSLNWQALPSAQLLPMANVGVRYQPEDLEKDSYWAQLPQAAIALQYGSPRSEPDYIIFRFARALGGQVLASRKVYEGDLGWDELSRLYALIKRRALGWDQVFQGVQEFLGKTKVPLGP